MKSWHIILIGLFLIVIVGMIIRFMAAKKLAELALSEASNINSNNQILLDSGIRRLYSK